VHLFLAKIVICITCIAGSSQQNCVSGRTHRYQSRKRNRQLRKTKTLHPI